MQQHGFSLTELLVTLAIAAILLVLATPSMRLIVDNTKVRGTAESVLSGLRFARAEAIKRNAPMRFQLVSTLTSACAYSTVSALWVVTQTDNTVRGQAAGFCDAQPYTPPDVPDWCNPDVPTGTATGNRPPGNPATCTDDPLISHKSHGVSTTDASIVVAADAAVVTFGPLGQVLNNLEGTASLTQVTASSTNASAKPWRVRVAAPGGTLKLCDPALAAGQPQACS